MDILEQWHKIEQEKFIHKPIKKEEIMEAIYQKSTGTMEILKTRLKYKMIWVLFFTLCFSGLLIWQFNNLTLAIIFGTATILYALGYLGLRKYHKQMGINRTDMNTVELLKSNAKLIKGALKFESQMMLPLFPFMLIGGMIIPRVMDGDNLAQLFSEPRFLIIMIIGVVIFTPLLKIMGDKMNNYAYGSYIKKLEDNIQEMEKIG